MKILSIVNFALKIILSKKGRSFLVALSILIGTGVLFVFFTFSNGVKQALLNPILSSSNPDTIVVSANKSDNIVLSLLNVNKGTKINQEVVDKISNFPETKSVGRLLVFKFLSTLRIWIPPGFDFDTDAPIFGIDIEMLPEMNLEQIQKDGEIPVAISPTIIDIFNSSFSESISEIPYLDPNNLLGRHLTIFFGKSSFGLFGTKEAVEKRAEIVVVSKRVPALGVAIPMDIALDIAEKIGGVSKKDVNFSKLFVRANNINQIGILQEKINNLGLQTKNFEEMGGKILTLAFGFKVTLLFASMLVIFVALLSLLSTISISVLEQKQTTGILRALGASKNAIIFIFLFEGLILGIIGAISGLLAGYLIASSVDGFLLSRIPDISLKPETFFPFYISTFYSIFLSIILFSLIATYFPAKNSIKNDPLEGILK